MSSARDHPEVVRDYLAGECAEGTILGPFPAGSLPGLQVSRFGVIPKGKSGKLHLIVDLSSPERKSVNDGIDSDLCSMSYVTVDGAVEVIRQTGRGSFLAKVDVRQAYRIVPVHPEDRPLLGMMWEGSLFVDSALPFGLRSAPKIFSAVADALEWLIRNEGVESVMHYLDDYLLVARTQEGCHEALQKLLGIFERLKVPVAPEKLEGPGTKLKFLGIELNTEEMSLRLPAEKLAELRMLVASWLGKRFCTVKELESLVGKLQHASKVIRPGRTFMRRMFELLRGARRGQRFVRLNAPIKSDLQWWHLFMAHWNGVAMMTNLSQGVSGPHLYSDASGTFGCWAWWGDKWFQLPWPQENGYSSIAQKELLPIVLACILWGAAWRGELVTAQCDNMAVVEVVNSGYSKDSALAQLLHVLFFARAQWEVEIKAVHIPGRQNVLADALSFAGSGSHQRTNRGANTARGAASDSPARLDVASLVPTVHQLFAAGLAPSTRRAYKSGAVRYARFCSMANRPPFPAREETVMLFVSLLHKEGLAPGTVKSYLAAVRFEQISRGMGDPEIGKMPRLEYVVKGMKRRAPRAVRCRLPNSRNP